VSDAAVDQAPIPSNPDDLKLIMLARAALARTAASQGACVRDTDGRSYASVNVELEHLKLSAVAVAVAMALSSGATALEAVAVAGSPPSQQDFEVLRDLAGSDIAVWSVDYAGEILDVSQL
jgi:cytidine deaminase